MKKYFLYFCSLLFSTLAISQNENENKAFDSIFYHIATNISSTNPPMAIYKADSLINNASNAKQRLKSIMLKADILEKQERRGEAIQQALQALEIAKTENDFSFQARIYGFLSTQYRTIGFLDKGKESINKGIEVSNHIKNKAQITKYLAMANQEMAEYALEEKEYRSAIEYLNKAVLLYGKEENETFKNFILGNSEDLLGRAEMALENKEKALKHFTKADSFINKADAGNTLWAALIYQGLGEAYRENKYPDSAEVYLNKALVIAEVGSHNSLKQKVYKSLSDFYMQRNIIDSFSKYNLKFNDISKINTAMQKEWSIVPIEVFKKLQMIIPIIIFFIL